MIRARCRTCRHFLLNAPRSMNDKNYGFEDGGICTRFPPATIEAEERPSRYPRPRMAVFPIVSVEMSCGEHAPADNLEPG